MRYFILFTLLVSASAGHADIDIKCNENGAVVTANSGEVYYLGKSCDAARKGGGTGKWWYAASALIVQIAGEPAVRFPFDLDCDVPYCRYNI